ncbi:Signal recognition particle protein [Ephemeroptericola cinctiostellae]|uniref:Signal recognition particle protein n=1 Tax=Ephemeroptericola cinctiostellae TaxID=2268024 RepID=A0A345D963_9BURK|nr:signal recognition particle protein [Ephemeroptericola cinctiostellae]AXF84901.1 Signal recognition particle protein [Ephemeroptericola cinctiostellae]
MLDNLSNRFSKIIKTMRGQARLTEENTAEMLREVRMALLEADVALPVVREFVANIKEKSLGEEVISSLTPGQALVGIVHSELVNLIGGEYDARAVELNLATTPPAIILMAGLQGAGKTTTVGKLAKRLVEQKKKVMTVSCDVYRPAAIEQLKSVTGQAGAEFFPSTPDQKPLDIAAAALDYARKHYIDVLLVDTAGRLGIDEAMMNEISALHAQLKPIETLFVVDAMAGQDAVNTAKAFNDALPLTGVVLTKLDGDSRGGAALSVRHVTGKPIKFVGMSEKIGGLEPFHPDRMAQRILGMGDIVSLVEEAHKNVDMEQAHALAKKIKSGKSFDLNDFKEQLAQMKKMGGVATLMDKLPSQMTQGAANMDMDKAEQQLRRTEGIINSMTPLERAKPDLIKASRKRRIAQGAGLHVQEVNKMLKQYEQMRDMMKKFQGGGMGKMMKMMGGMKGIKNMMGGGGKMPF